jgi:hypothetical protein
MNIRKILSASVLASAIIFSGTACSSPVNPVTPDGLPNPNVTQQETGEEDQVVAVVNGFYDYVTTPENADRIAEAGERFSGRTEVSDEELQQMVADFPDVFKYFDTATSENVKNAYGQLVAGVSLASTVEGIKITAPKEAVKQYGSTATVNSTMVTIKTPARTMDSSADPDSIDLVQLVKKDGKWLMVATNPTSSKPAQ